MPSLQFTVGSSYCTLSVQAFLPPKVCSVLTLKVEMSFTKNNTDASIKLMTMWSAWHVLLQIRLFGHFAKVKSILMIPFLANTDFECSPRRNVRQTRLFQDVTARISG